MATTVTTETVDANGNKTITTETTGGGGGSSGGAPGSGIALALTIAAGAATLLGIVTIIYAWVYLNIYRSGMDSPNYSACNDAVVLSNPNAKAVCSPTSATTTAPLKFPQQDGAISDVCGMSPQISMCPTDENDLSSSAWSAAIVAATAGGAGLGTTAAIVALIVSIPALISGICGTTGNPSPALSGVALGFSILGFVIAVAMIIALSVTALGFQTLNKERDIFKSYNSKGNGVYCPDACQKNNDLMKSSWVAIETYYTVLAWFAGILFLLNFLITIFSAIDCCGQKRRAAY